MQTPLVGQRIGQYRVEELIGRGGMASVYRGHDEMLSREVALKVLDPDAESSADRFRTEALALARISHPGIAAVYQLLQHDDHLVMVMELVHGQTLHQLSERDGVLSPERAAEICMQALTALAHAHAAGVVHRDLKPANLMMTDSGGLKIMDFGIARLDGAARLTLAGMVMGTPAYMAPEQIRGKEVDARADLYALGVVFYWLVTGTLPFHGETQFATLEAQLQDPPTSASSVRSDLPSWVDDVVTRALQKDPGQRFQTATDFREGLSTCLAGRPLPPLYRVDGDTDPIAIAPDAAPPVRARQRRPMRRWVGGAIAAGVCGMIWLEIGPAAAPPAETANEVVSVTTAEVSYSPLPALDARSNAAAKPLLAKPVVVANETPSTLFDQVKLLVIDGTRTTDRDVLLLFANGRIAALPPGGGEPVAAVPYAQIVKATYAKARTPQWDAAFGAPPDRLDMPGFLGRSRHWLVVQTKDSYAILRLDGDQWRTVLENLESRVGLKITRPSAANK